MDGIPHKSDIRLSIPESEEGFESGLFEAIVARESAESSEFEN